MITGYYDQLLDPLFIFLSLHSFVKIDCKVVLIGNLNTGFILRLGDWSTLFCD